ncbi:hypothetical protein C0Q44_13500 [Paenibacillus sp. PCH8]|uniref:hypothetical protein n=1 Tax=Paenibacillus sp. PCH8 TaxID=2066524 RepID=UPI000CFA0259|nr:hypothetical protein [Paenibacillus sp. PCH8]PQP82453.1 hypothetical protein C0Q44_13500 [Paenibacillus sp. PCH8]
MVTYTENLIPNMKSDTAPSGRAFASSFNLNGAFMAFDNSDTYGYVSGNGSVGHIGYEFINPVRIGKYIVRSLSATYFPHMPKNWTFEGSDDGVNWTVLDTQVNQTWTTANTDKEYIIDYNKAKRYKTYRLNWTANNGGAQVVINELKMFGVDYFDKFLISTEGEYYSVISELNGESTAIPSMTNNTTPTGKAFAGSEYSTDRGAWRAFDRTETTYASRDGAGTSGYLGYEFKNSLKIGKYVIRNIDISSSSLQAMPKDWTFEGSNEGIAWVTLDRQVNQTWTAAYTDKEYLINNSKVSSYKMYRLNWTATNGWRYAIVTELKMYEYTSGVLTKISDSSEQAFLHHGINKDTVIDLNSKISEGCYIVQDITILGSGNVFKQKFDTSKLPIKKVSIK